MRNAALALFVLCLPVSAQVKTPPRVGVGDTEVKLTLIRTIELAIENNLEIAIERTNRETATEDARGARGWLDPHFTLSPQIQDVNMPTSSSLIGPDGMLEQTIASIDGAWEQRLPWWGANIRVALENSRQKTSNPFDSLSPFNAATIGANLTLPLTRNRSIDAARANLVIANKQVDLSASEFETLVIGVIARAQAAYWNLVAARQNVLVTSEAVDLAREQLARTRRMIDSGTLAPVELAAAEAELERRIDTWYASIGLVTEIENAFKILVTEGEQDALWDNQIVPTEESTLAPPEFSRVREAVDLALDKRPELRQVDLRTETNDIQKSLARDRTRTQVNLVGGYSLEGLSGTVADTSNPFTGVIGGLYGRVDDLSAIHGFDPLPAVSSGGVPTDLVGSYGRMWKNLFNGKYPTAYAGIQIDFTARNRAAKAELAKSLVAERRLHLQREQLALTITAEVRNALQAIQTARQRITAADASVRAAQEKLESESRLFQSGESTNFLVLTRQNELADSRQRAVVARLDFNKAVAETQRALGTTLETFHIQLK